MDRREIDLVRAMCHEVDCLVTSDPGTSDLEVLERARLKMNDLLYKEKWLEAEELAYAILRKHAGVQAGRYLSEMDL